MPILVGKCLFASTLFGISVVLFASSFIGHGLKLNHPVLVAQSAPVQEATLLAVHEEKLAQMSRESQAGIDDRKVLHAALATLTDRINVDEAEAKTAARMFGLLFSLFTGTSALVAILEFRRKSGKP